jgi:hypothetical protein
MIFHRRDAEADAEIRRGFCLFSAFLRVAQRNLGVSAVKFIANLITSNLG